MSPARDSTELLSDAWRAYRGGFSEVRHLLRIAKSAGNEPLRGSNLSEQQVYLRAAIVLLAAHVEGFFRSVPEEYADAIQGSWDRQNRGVRRYIALSAMRRLDEELRDIRAGDCDKESEVDAVRRLIVGTSRWFSKPSRVSEDRRLPQLEGFYRQRGARAIESLLVSFSPRERKFFDWLGARGFDRSRFWTVLEGLVVARNMIAHGNGNPSLSVRDVRQYLAICTVVVRQARAFLSS